MTEQEAIQVCQQEVQRLVTQVGVSPSTLMNYGNMATKAIKNPQIKKQLLQDAISRGVVQKQDFSQGLS